MTTAVRFGLIIVFALLFSACTRSAHVSVFASVAYPNDKNTWDRVPMHVEQLDIYELQHDVYLDRKVPAGGRAGILELPDTRIVSCVLPAGSVVVKLGDHEGYSLFRYLDHMTSQTPTCNSGMEFLLHTSKFEISHTRRVQPFSDGSLQPLSDDYAERRIKSHLIRSHRDTK